MKSKSYPASFDIDYPKEQSRLTTFFRIFLTIPILVILTLLTMSSFESLASLFNDKSEFEDEGGIIVGLFAVTALMILFRQRYPRWWFDFNLELQRFSARVAAYLFLLTDKYPSTEDKQSVRLDLVYPNVKKDLNRWLPLVKWLLALPHYVVLMVLAIAAILATVIAWFAILFTGNYPKNLFDFVVGVGRWGLRVQAYALLLVTDKYPPFSLK
ncbi:DUF4389 domain-containing protein [Candidatus Saccharibacteria bacterium]|nr:MAG: DUF4389 domain-containing protein [Candidatus Saccharibacteria bacterium]